MNRIYSPGPTVRASRVPLYMQGFRGAPTLGDDSAPDIPYDPGSFDWSSYDYGASVPVDPGLTPPDLYDYPLPVVDPLSLDIPGPDFSVTPLTPEEQALINNLPLNTLSAADLAALNTQLTPMQVPQSQSWLSEVGSALKSLFTGGGGSGSGGGGSAAGGLPGLSPTAPKAPAPTVPVTPAGTAASVIPGIPNSALLLGGAGVLLLVMFMPGGKR